MTSQPSQESRALSHGRGGAGNIAKDDPSNSHPKAEDLVTPTLKSETYTTGRGGSGNMAQNDPYRPEVARAAQDVEGPVSHADAKGPVHFGRGGAANITGQDGQRKSGDVKRRSGEEGTREEVGQKGGIVAKGKEFLNKLNNNKK